MKSAEALYQVYAEVIMKISSVVNLRSEKTDLESVKPCVNALLEAAFHCKSASASFDNTLFVYMGLLKVNLCVIHFLSGSIITLIIIVERRKGL